MRNSIAELALACVATHPSVGERALADVLSQLNSSLHRETHERLVNENECSKKEKVSLPQRGPSLSRASVAEAFAKPSLLYEMHLDSPCSVEVALLSHSKRTNSIERVIRNNRNTKK